MRIKNYFRTLTKFERALWICSLIVVAASYLLALQGVLNLFTSLIGVTALIFLAKGMIIGQIISIAFSVFYGIISYKFGYYGEMITYLFMTLPMAVISTIEWLKNPYKNTDTVKVSKVKRSNIVVMFLLCILTTFIFFFLLKYLNTANLLFSTISIATSFVAAYLCALRSPYFALAYAANDVGLIVLWTLASIKDISFLPMIACFIMFLFNDLYGFFNWCKMQKEQK